MPEVESNDYDIHAFVTTSSEDLGRLPVAMEIGAIKVVVYSAGVITNLPTVPYLLPSTIFHPTKCVESRRHARVLYSTKSIGDGF
jgi:hypothetical protein